MFDFKKLSERGATSFSRFGCFCVSWNPQLLGDQEIDAKQGSNTQQRVLKKVMKTIRVREVAGNGSGVMCVIFRGAAGNSSVVLEINLKGPCWTATI